ncbi:MAG: hypothetical protein CML46_08930 [Rhodobacteraceae bacterium]|nr:hypothetical protein [Paracoccaceae bacterium]MBR27049.1 hypothetical protein [Paracoccaceae bacterium]
MAFPLLPLVAAVAPALVSRLAGEHAGGPLGTAVGAAVREATGVEPGAPGGVEAALAAARADAQVMATLKARLAEVALERSAAELADRADARARDVALASHGRRGRRADMMLAAAFAAVVGIALVMFLLSLSKGAENSALVNTLVGFLTGIGGMFARNIGTAFDFEFGSSRSSREKDGQLAGLAARGAIDPLEAFRRRLAE